MSLLNELYPLHKKRERNETVDRKRGVEGAFGEVIDR